MVAQLTRVADDKELWEAQVGKFFSLSCRAASSPRAKLSVGLLPEIISKQNRLKSLSIAGFGRELPVNLIPLAGLTKKLEAQFGLKINSKALACQAEDSLLHYHLERSRNRRFELT